jgi:Xaa-Pro aminopeptidase
VLKGHIAIDRAVFPKGTTGLKIDILARMYLWRDGLDYNHGTGALPAEQRQWLMWGRTRRWQLPASISPRDGSNKVALKAGMVLSNGLLPGNRL